MRIIHMNNSSNNNSNNSGSTDSNIDNNTGSNTDRNNGNSRKKGSQQYELLTNTPVFPLIVRLSIPTILSMLITNIYNLADTAFVGKLGNSASGAVGIVFGFMSILQAVGFLFGQGCGSILSRREGAGDYKGASRAASIGFFGALFFSSLIAVTCFVFLEPLIYMLGSTPTIYPYARTYITWILLAAPCLVSSFTMNNILRYEGKASIGTIGMMTGAILNMVGDPILIFGFKLGIAGAGISTAVSQIISFSIMLSMFLRGKTQAKLSFKLLMESKDFLLTEFFDIVGTGFPSLLRQALNSVSTVILNSSAGLYGDAAVAAMSIVTRVSFFVFSLALGIGQGFQPVCAFNYGAGKINRLRKAYKVTLVLAEVVMVIMSVLVLINPEAVIRLFRDDDQVVAMGVRALKLQVTSQVFLPFCMVNEMSMQSTGRKLGASVLSSTRSGLFFIPALLILPKLRGFAGIQEAQPLAMVLSLIPAAYFANKLFKELRSFNEKV